MNRKRTHALTSVQIYNLATVLYCHDEYYYLLRGSYVLCTIQVFIEKMLFLLNIIYIKKKSSNPYITNAYYAKNVIDCITQI